LHHPLGYPKNLPCSYEPDEEYEDALATARRPVRQVNRVGISAQLIRTRLARGKYSITNVMRRRADTVGPPSCRRLLIPHSVDAQVRSRFIADDRKGCRATQYNMDVLDAEHEGGPLADL
jgi:hypothetical protein